MRCSICGNALAGNSIHEFHVAMATTRHLFSSCPSKVHNTLMLTSESYVCLSLDKGEHFHNQKSQAASVRLRFLIYKMAL